jgi:hypothetical protein
MEPMDRDYVVAAFDRMKKGRALRKLGHPATASDTRGDRLAQSEREPPADSKSGDLDQNLDRA